MYDIYIYILKPKQYESSSLFLFGVFDCMLVLEVWELRCFLEGVLCCHDPLLAELESTCQTSGQVASSHRANSRPDIWPVFDVQTGITEVVCSRP